MNSNLPKSEIAYRSVRVGGVVRNERDKAEARRNRSKSGRPASPADVRECELYTVIRHVFGASLPDDDYGRDVLRELLNQLALRGASSDEMRDTALHFLPELDDDDSLAILIKEIGKGRKRRADHVARALGVTYQMRTFLDLRSIGACDIPKKERDAIQRQKEAADRRWQREQAGAKPQAQSAAQLRPWLEWGISKATYYRRKQKAAAENAKNGPRDHFGDRTLSILPMDEPVSGDQPALPSREITDAEVEHRGETSPTTGKPLSHQQEPLSVVSAVAASCGAVLGSADASFRERAKRALEYLQLKGVMTRTAAQAARLAELDEIIKTERDRRAWLAEQKRAAAQYAGPRPTISHHPYC